MNNLKQYWDETEGHISKAMLRAGYAKVDAYEIETHRISFHRGARAMLLLLHDAGVIDAVSVSDPKLVTIMEELLKANDGVPLGPFEAPPSKKPN